MLASLPHCLESACDACPLCAAFHVLFDLGLAGHVAVHDVATGELRREIEHHADLRIWTLAASPHGIVSAGGDLGKLALYDASTGRLQRELRPSSPGGKVIEHSCFFPAGASFMSFLYRFCISVLAFFSI